MKKYILVLILIFVLSLTFNKDEKVAFVFENQDIEYSMYILEFNNNISTNNIETIFKEIKIIWIQPLVKSLYKNKLEYKYYFEDISLKQNVNRFKKDFINKLNENNYNSQAINYEVVGIIVNKMKVYCKEEDIQKLNINGLKYKKYE